MIQKAITICSLSVFITIGLFAQTLDTTQKLTLQQCVQIALQNNADVQHREVTSDIAKVTWQGSKGYMLPTLNGDIGHGINTGRNIDPYTNTIANQSVKYDNYSLNTSLTLFNAFAIQNNIRQNKLAYQASTFEIQSEKDFIAMSVILEYLQVLTNEDLLTVSLQQQDVSEKQVERLNILNQEGAVSPSQFYDLKGEYANNQLNAVNAQNSLETAKVTLAQLLNIPYNKNQQLERLTLSDIGDNTNSNTDSIYQSALQNLAIVKAAQLRQRSAIYGLRSFRSQRYPSLYFSGGIFTNYSDNATEQQYVNTTEVQTSGYVLNGPDKLPVFVSQDNYSINKIKYANQFKNNFNSSFVIGLSIPILNNLRNKTQIKTALLQQKDADVTLNATKMQLQQNVGQAYVNVNSAKTRYDVLSDQVNAYKESFREAEIKFNSGAINSVDYLIAKNNLDQSNLNLIIAKYDYVLRSMILDYYSGKLTF
ncbi:MAG: TolC family protein [Parafilimonas sp.]|nr:TolC family protein [Parafilimonas sp.]